MNPTRRSFLKGVLAAAGVGIGAPIAYLEIRNLHNGTALLPGESAHPSGEASPAAAPASGSALPSAQASAKPQPRSLVVIQLAGGNDGLATVLPYADPVLKDNRPTLTFTDEQLLKLDGNVALHPNMKALKGLWDQHKVAIVQGVGYPDPNRSHFASMDIWQSATPGKPSDTGWLGRYLDAAELPADNPFNAASVGGSIPQSLKGKNATVAALQDVRNFTFKTDPRFPQDHADVMGAFAQLYQHGPAGASYYGVVERAESTAASAANDLKDAATRYQSSVTYPQTPLGRSLADVAQLLAGGFGTRVFHVATGGFDTHSGEKNAHDRLMTDLSDSITAFYNDLNAHGLSQNVVMMTWSEFGRRVKENGSSGTDHGTAAPLFVVGDAVNGGLVGDQPSLSKLDGNGDLVFGIDFRAVYNTILSKWLGMDGQEVLGGKFELLPLLKG